VIFFFFFKVDLNKTFVPRVFRFNTFSDNTTKKSVSVFSKTVFFMFSTFFKKNSTSTSKSIMSSNNSRTSSSSAITFSEKFNPITAMKPSEWKVSTKEERESMEAIYQEELAKWRQHPNWSSTLARHFVEDVHAGMFRRNFKAILAHYKQTGEVSVHSFQRVNRSLQGHHNGEDSIYFPAQMQMCPEMKSAFDYLSLDHQQLHPLEEKIIKNADGNALEEFVSFLCDHLNREEQLLVPYMLARRTPF
jgi:hypothetical protein